MQQIIIIESDHRYKLVDEVRAWMNDYPTRKIVATSYGKEKGIHMMFVTYKTNG